MEQKPVRRRPPRTLQLNTKQAGEQAADEKPPITSPGAPRVRLRSSPFIEKLQANLALSPTALLPSPKSPDGTLPASPFPAGHAHSPLAPPSPALSSPSSARVSEEQSPVSFENPPEGAALPSINKDRARLSFKRRPPTRQLRKSCGDEEGATGGRSSPCQQEGQREKEGEEEAAERTNRKGEVVRARNSSGGDSGERGAGMPGADEDRQEVVPITQEVKPAGDEAPAGPEGEGLPGEPCSGDRVIANQKEGAESQPQEEEGKNVIDPDEVTIEFAIK